MRAFCNHLASNVNSVPTRFCFTKRCGKKKSKKKIPTYTLLSETRIQTKNSRAKCAFVIILWKLIWNTPTAADSGQTVFRRAAVGHFCVDAGDCRVQRRAADYARTSLSPDHHIPRSNPNTNPPDYPAPPLHGKVNARLKILRK